MKAIDTKSELYQVEKNLQISFASIGALSLYTFHKKKYMYSWKLFKIFDRSQARLNS